MAISFFDWGKNPMLAMAVIISRMSVLILGFSFQWVTVTAYFQYARLHAFHKKFKTSSQ